MKELEKLFDEKLYIACSRGKKYDAQSDILIYRIYIRGTTMEDIATHFNVTIRTVERSIARVYDFISSAAADQVVTLTKPHSIDVEIESHSMISRCSAQAYRIFLYSIAVYETDYRSFLVKEEVPPGKKGKLVAELKNLKYFSKTGIYSVYEYVIRQKDGIKFKFTETFANEKIPWQFLDWPVCDSLPRWYCFNKKEDDKQ